MNGVGRLLVFVFLAGLLCSPLLSRAAVLTDEDKVTLTPPSPEIEAAVAKALEGCPPTGGKKVRAGINKNGTYTLVGNLFKDGEIVAVVDFHEYVALCTWKNSHWKPTAMLDGYTAWKYPGWDRKEHVERTPDATKPFWMLTLAGHRLLVIASVQAKAGQNYFIILFDARHRRMSDLGYSFGFAPTVKDDYLITGDASRVKSTWEATYFSRIVRGKFVELNRWEGYRPYNQPDPSEYDGDVSCCMASSQGRTYTIMDDYSTDEPPADWIVFNSGTGLDGWQSLLDKQKTNPIWAKVYLTPRKKPKDELDYVNVSEDTLAYLFEKLTGLPRRLYKVGFQMTRENVETKMKIKIVGDPEAVKILSPKTRR